MSWIWLQDEWVCGDCHGHGNLECIRYLRLQGKDIQVNQCCKCYILVRPHSPKVAGSSAVEVSFDGVDDDTKD